MERHPEPYILWTNGDFVEKRAVSLLTSELSARLSLWPSIQFSTKLYILTILIILHNIQR